MLSWLPGVERVLNKTGDVRLYDAIKDTKFVAIYFSASSNQSCQQFTPILTRFYQEINRSDKVMEIIFVSSD